MKKIYTILSFLVLSTLLSQAQVCTTDVPMSAAFDSTYVVAFSIIDSMDINMHQGYSNGQFVLCENSTFKFKGNQSSSSPTFYLMQGATLILEDSYFYPTIYMSPTSTLDAKGGSQNVSLYREMTASLLDTANCLWLSDTTYTQMNITFTTWPGGNSPCTVAPNSIHDIAVLKGNINAIAGRLNYQMSDNGKFDLFLFDLEGRALIKESITNPGSVNVSHLAKGIYIVNIRKGNKVLKQKVLLD